MKQEHYSETYYRSISGPSRVAAERILPRLDEAIHPTSIVDVGCGAGAWLEVWARVLSKTDYLGIDGDHVDENQLLIPRDHFQARDVSERFDIARRFDLAMALEVAEHLEPARSEPFVENLVRLSSRVLFSAAPPGQGGRNHINERPHSYWKGIFERHGYSAFDYVRPHALQFPDIEPWFKYNPLLFVADSACAQLPRAVLQTRLPQGAPVEDLSPMAWRGRKLILSRMPVAVVSALSDLKHRMTVMFGRT